MNRNGFSQDSIESVLKAFMESGDAKGFLEMVGRVKQSAIAMIEQDALEDAIKYMEAYNGFLRRHQSSDASFNEHVISLYPANQSFTYKMLGQSDALDQYILSAKTDISVMTEMRKPPYKELLRHALIKCDSPLFNHLLGEILESVDKITHEGLRASALKKLLMAVFYSVGSTESLPTSVRVEPEYDSFLSTIVRADPDHSVRWSTLSRLATLGFKNTVRSCFVSGRAKNQGADDGPYLNEILTAFDGESPLSVFSALGLVGVHSKKNKHQLAFIRTLLGDCRFEFERFIEIAATSYQFRSFRSATVNPRLGFHHLEYFGKWLSPEYLTTGLERCRAEWLVRQVCAAETEGYLDGKVCVTGLRMINRGEPVIAYIKKMLDETEVHSDFHQCADIIKRDALANDLNI